MALERVTTVNFLFHVVVLEIEIKVDGLLVQSVKKYFVHLTQWIPAQHTADLFIQIYMYMQMYMQHRPLVFIILWRLTNKSQIASFVFYKKCIHTPRTIYEKQKNDLCDKYGSLHRIAKFRDPYGIHI